MRLIDADELIKGRVENDPVRIAAMCAPTAYDVEAVIKNISDIIYDESIRFCNQTINASLEYVRDGFIQIMQRQESPDGKRLREREKFFGEG